MITYSTDTDGCVIAAAPWFENDGKLCCEGKFGGISPVILDKKCREFIALLRNAFAGDPEALVWWKANCQSAKPKTERNVRR